MLLWSAGKLRNYFIGSFGKIKESKAAPGAGAVSEVDWRKDISGQNIDFTDVRRRKGLT